MTALQKAYEAIDAVMGPSMNPLIRAKVRGLMAGYDARWRDQDYRPVDVELYREAPLVNPETGATSRTFRIAGKLDVVARDARGMLYVIDHKTTSENIEDANSMYWRQLVVESQPSQYMLLEWMNGRKVAGAVWDVIRKPTIRPRKLSRAERARVVGEGRWFGARVSEHDRTCLAGVDECETPAMYEARLVADIAETPERYFQRRSVPRLDGELVEYAQETSDVAQEIRLARLTGRNYRSSGACIQYSSPCEFLGICSGYDTPDSERWRKAENVHDELPIVGGKNVLTNSRIRCFQACRKKHLYRYEMGLRRADAEEREALWFGTVMHAALEAWWRFFLPA